MEVVREQGRAIEALTREVRTLRGSSPHVLLSFREAAKRLGVDRNKVLPELVRRGELRTVDVNGQKRIPAEEIERLARQGFDVTGPAKPRARREKKKAATTPADVAASIRKLKL